MSGAELFEPWYVYVVECRDGSLYTGIARDVGKRIALHNEGKGAKYTRGRGPVRMLAASPALDRSPALVLEARLKKLKAEDKVRAVSCLASVAAIDARASAIILHQIEER